MMSTPDAVKMERLSSVTLAVVVPFFNSFEALQRTALALDLQTDAPDEVVIVDDGSSSVQSDLVRSLVTGRPTWRLIRTGNRGPSAARNTGARATTCDCFAFLDCDDEPAPAWVGGFKRALSQPDIGLVRCAIAFIAGEKGSAPAGARPLPGSFGITRQAFELVGGYDERLRFGENSDLLRRATACCAVHGFGVELIDRPLIGVRPPSDRAKYDENRVEANEYLLRRDFDELRHDPHRRARLAAIGSMSAARLGQRGRALRLAVVAIRAEPTQRRHWLRLALLLAPARHLRWRHRHRH
jgi:glycosyltransferase involved in cell wall biosynthesis